MVQTVESLTQARRDRTNDTLGAYARLAVVQNTAQRLHRLAFSAATAYQQGSADEALTLLRAMDCAVDQITGQIETATIRLAEERAE